MEVIGAVSSVVALVEVTGKLAKGLTHLAQKWHNAPDEIHALALATQELSIKFAYVQETVTNSPTTLVDDVARRGLTQLVDKTQSVTTELSALHTRLEAYNNISQRARWAVKDAKIANSALAKLREVEEGLSMWISFISLKGHSLTLQQSHETQQILMVGFEEMKQMFSAVTITNSLPGTSSDPNGTSGNPLSPPTQVMTARTNSTSAVRRMFGGVSWEAGSTWQSWGLHGKVIWSTKGASTDYDVAFSIRLPLAWWSGARILKGALAMSVPRQNTLTLRHPSYLAVGRVLDSLHPFFDACMSNDVAVIREMLRNGEGRPTDENPSGYGPLWHAICCGSFEAVVELLENGADMDTAINYNQSTPLELAARNKHMDVLRMLLGRGASADHCDIFGIDVYVSCWYPRSSCTEEFSSRDVFNVVNEYIALDHTYTWGAGLTVLQAAATVVKGSDIDALISYGHNIEGTDMGGRTALFYAASFGNPSAFFALLAQGADLDYESFSVELMLHERVRGKANNTDRTILPARGYDAIARHLLQDGRPDLGLLIEISPESYSDPASIRRRKVTLKQIAEANGPKIEAWFLTLLRESGQPHFLTKEDKRRLNALRLAGYALHGCVLGDGEDHSENDETDQTEDQTDGVDVSTDDGDGDSDASSTCTQDETSDVGEEEQFWDADQGL